MIASHGRQEGVEETARESLLPFPLRPEEACNRAVTKAYVTERLHFRM